MPRRPTLEPNTPKTEGAKRTMDMNSGHDDNKKKYLTLVSHTPGGVREFLGNAELDGLRAVEFHIGDGWAGSFVELCDTGGRSANEMSIGELMGYGEISRKLRDLACGDHLEEKDIHHLDITDRPRRFMTHVREDARTGRPVTFEVQRECPQKPKRERHEGWSLTYGEDGKADSVAFDVPLGEDTIEAAKDALATLAEQGIRAVEFDGGCWPGGSVGASWLLLYDTGGLSADYLVLEALTGNETSNQWREWSGGGIRTPLEEIEHRDVTDDPWVMAFDYAGTQKFDVLRAEPERVLVEDENIRVKLTGRTYDFIATIENKTDHDILIKYPETSDLASELFTVKAGGWAGFLAEPCSHMELEAILNGEYEIDGPEAARAFDLECR